MAVQEETLCERCGKPFKKKRYWQKSCNRECQLEAYYIKKLNESKTRKKTSTIILFMFFFCTEAFASTPEYFNKVTDAIFLAEGGDRAKVPYGILSVKVSSKEEARKVCYNTVRNNWKRWEAAGRPGTYLEFLARRYAPIGVANDPKGLNKNWLSNVERLMR